MAKYTVTLRFNARGKGGRVASAILEAESVGDALEQMIVTVSRNPMYGGSIYIHGVSVDELNNG